MIYLNSKGETFEEQPGAQLTIDAWGLDTITRKYRGKTAYVQNFIDTLRKNRTKPDPYFKALTLTNYVLTNGRAWVDVDVTYKGTFDGKLPDPIFSGGVTTQSVQLDYKDSVTEQLTSALGVTYTKPTTELTYKATFVSIRYVTRKIPAVAQYPEELNGVVPVVSIVNQTGGRGGIALVPLAQPRIANVPIIGNISDPVALPAKENLFNGITNIVNEGPNWTQEGQFYLCEEKNQVTIMPFSFAALRWNILLNQTPAS